MPKEVVKIASVLRLRPGRLAAHSPTCLYVSMSEERELETARIIGNCSSTAKS